MWSPLTTWAQIHDLTFRPHISILHYNPDWNVLLTLAVKSPFIRKVAIFKKIQLTADILELPLAIITWPYRGLRYRPTEFEFFFLNLSADKLLLFDHYRLKFNFFNAWEIGNVFMSRTIKGPYSPKRLCALVFLFWNDSFVKCSVLIGFHFEERCVTILKNDCEGDYNCSFLSERPVRL